MKVIIVLLVYISVACAIKPLWSVGGGDQNNGAACSFVFNDTLYTPGQRGSLKAVSLIDGKTKWTSKKSNQPVSPLNDIECLKVIHVPESKMIIHIWKGYGDTVMIAYDMNGKLLWKNQRVQASSWSVGEGYIYSSVYKSEAVDNRTLIRQLSLENGKMVRGLALPPLMYVRHHRSSKISTTISRQIFLVGSDVLT